MIHELFGGSCGCGQPVGHGGECIVTLRAERDAAVQRAEAAEKSFNNMGVAFDATVDDLHALVIAILGADPDVVEEYDLAMAAAGYLRRTVSTQSEEIRTLREALEQAKTDFDTIAYAHSIRADLQTINTLRENWQHTFDAAWNGRSRVEDAINGLSALAVPQPAPCPDCDTGFPEGRMCPTCKGSASRTVMPDPRAIDALGAEHCMGWHESPYGNWFDVPFSFDVDPIHQRAFRSWSPSTDPAASKQLRDKMRADGWNIGIHIPGAPYKKVACLVWRAGGKGESRGEADTEEMAVALAALKTKGIEVA